MNGSKPIFYQEWHNLLFLHWKVKKDAFDQLIPSDLEVDTYNDSAWIGIIPFQMKRLRPRYLSSFPPVSNFTEVNLRTYVKDKYGRKGVWFFSLDTSNRLGNFIAYNFFHLNYRYSKTYFEISNRNKYSCKIDLKQPGIPVQVFEWEDDPDTNYFKSNSTSLDFFLTERYRLYSYDHKRKKLLTGAITHEPYKLYTPKLIKYGTGLFESNKISATIDNPDSVIASKMVKVKVFPLENVK